MAKNIEKKGIFDGISPVALPKKKEEPVKPEKVETVSNKEIPAPKSQEDAPVPKETAPIFAFKKSEKEKKTVHKGFLITESMNNKYKALAEKLNMNENQLFETILKQVFESTGL